MYFPTTGFISLVTPLDACAGIEVVLVGSEGMVGTSVLLGAAVSPLHHLVHGSGMALRMSAAAFRRELERAPALRRRLSDFLFTLGRVLNHRAGVAEQRWIAREPNT